MIVLPAAWAPVHVYTCVDLDCGHVWFDCMHLCCIFSLCHSPKVPGHVSIVLCVFNLCSSCFLPVISWDVAHLSPQRVSSKDEQTRLSLGDVHEPWSQCIKCCVKYCYFPASCCDVYLQLWSMWSHQFVCHGVFQLRVRTNKCFS